MGYENLAEKNTGYQYALSSEGGLDEADGEDQEEGDAYTEVQAIAFHRYAVEHMAALQGKVPDIVELPPTNKSRIASSLLGLGMQGNYSVLEMFSPDRLLTRSEAFTAAVSHAGESAFLQYDGSQPLPNDQATDSLLQTMPSLVTSHEAGNLAWPFLGAVAAPAASQQSEPARLSGAGYSADETFLSAASGGAQGPTWRSQAMAAGVAWLFKKDAPAHQKISPELGTYFSDSELQELEAFFDLVQQLEAGKRTPTAAENIAGVFASLWLPVAWIRNVFQLAGGWPDANAAVLSGHFRAPEVAAEAAETEQSRAGVISHEELEAQRRLIETLEIPDLRRYFNHRHEPGARVRAKRTVTATAFRLSSDAVADRIKSPRNFREALRRLTQDATGDAYVKNAVRVDQPVMIILAELSLLSDLVKKNSNDDVLNQTYHFAFLALEQYWANARSISEKREAGIVADFAKDWQQKKWESHDPHVQELSDLDVFIQGHDPEWAKQRITESDRVVIHTETEARSFLLGDILNQDHAEFVRNKKISVHFLFDRSGLFDQSLHKFVIFSIHGLSGRFHNIRERLLNRQIAQSYLEAYLKELGATSAGFTKQTLLQTLSKDVAHHVPEQRAAIGALISRVLLQPDWTATEYAILAYARNLVSDLRNDALFQSQDIDAMLDTEYAYDFTDAIGRKRAGMVTLPEYLSKRTGAYGSTHIDIAHRRVTMKWPFGKKQVMHFDKLSRQVETFAKEIERHRVAIKAADDLAEYLPSIETMLEQILADICRDLNMHGYQLSDTIEFSYPQSAIDQGSAMMARKVDPVIEKFTVREILLGQQRSVEVKERYHRLPVVTGIEGRKTLSASVARFADGLRKFPTQETVLKTYDQLKGNRQAKEHFAHFLKIITPPISKGTRSYEFEDTPLLLIYSKHRVRKVLPPGPAIGPVWNVTTIDFNRPFSVLSRKNGQVFEFSSFADMQEKFAENPELAKTFKFHFFDDVGDDFAKAAIIERHNEGMDAFYGRYHKWMRTNFDKMILSHGEAMNKETMEFISDLLFLVGVPAVGGALVPAVLAETVLFALPKLEEAITSDRSDDRREQLKEMIEGALMQVATAGLSHGGGKLFSAVKKMHLNSEQRINVPHDDWHAAVTRDELPDELALFCPARAKRGIADGICQIGLNLKNILKTDAPAVAKEDFETFVSQHNADFSVSFSQDKDFINPALRDQRFFLEAVTAEHHKDISQLERGMCRGLSLAVANEVMHGDSYAVSVLQFFKDMEKQAAISAAGYKLDIAHFDGVTHALELQRLQRASYDPEEVTLLRAQKTAVMEEVSKVMKMVEEQKAQGIKLSPEDAEKIIKVGQDLQSLNNRGAELDQMHKENMQAWARQNGLQSQTYEYKLTQGRKRNEQMKEFLFEELKKPEPAGVKAILFNTQGHAMVLFHSGNGYSFFEPNYGLVSFDSIAALEGFVTDVFALPQYGIIPSVDVLTIPNPSGLEKEQLMKGLPVTKMGEIIAANAAGRKMG